MDNFVLTTPVALLVFNRPELTAQVFAAVREARPSRLLVVADGPRFGRRDDLEKCTAVRRIVEQVDWPCEVLKNYSDTNLGCRIRVSSGLDWVFNQVEEAIILEDDCLPDPSFFRFCQELLERYRNSTKVGMLSGNNFQQGRHVSDDSYYFSRFFHVWGWATWRDRWTGIYDVAMKQWPSVRNVPWLAEIFGKSNAKLWWDNFEQVYCGRIDTWDYQWVFANWLKDRFCVIPSINLVTNIGFGPEATHTKKGPDSSLLKRFSVEFPLRHPVTVSVNTMADGSSQQICRQDILVVFLRRLFSGWQN